MKNAVYVRGGGGHEASVLVNTPGALLDNSRPTNRKLDNTENDS